jgi:hypothetical protein
MKSEPESLSCRMKEIEYRIADTGGRPVLFRLTVQMQSVLTILTAVAVMFPMYEILPP